MNLLFILSWLVWGIIMMWIFSDLHGRLDHHRERIIELEKKVEALENETRDN